MANMLDYLDERGDAPFGEEGFCEVDALALSQLAYLDLGGIVPAIGDEGSLSVEDAARAFFRAHPKEELYGVGGIASPLTPFVLQKMAEGDRFRGARLMAYESSLDEGRHEQFCAITADLGSDAGLFVAFRGTDDTLLGWREDFEMSFEVVASQRDALAYLELVSEQNSQRLLRVGGHSKGGNLAVYAVTLADDRTRGRVMEAFDFDGPGFRRGVLPRRAWRAVSSRVRRYSPGYCIVGALFDRGSERVYVESDETGVMQHAAMSWQIAGSSLVRRDGPEPEAEEFDRALAGFIAGRGTQGRRRLVSALFSILAAAGATTISELSRSGPSDWARILAAAGELSLEDRECVEQLAGILAGAVAGHALRPLFGRLERALGVGSRVPSGDGAKAGRRGQEAASEEESAQRGKRRWLTYISLSEMRAFRERRREGVRRIPSVARLVELATRPSRARGILAVALGLVVASNVGLSIPIACLVGFVCGAAAGVVLLARFARLARTSPAHADVRDLVGGGAAVLVCALLLLLRPAATLLFNLLAGAALLAGGVRSAGRLRTEKSRTPSLEATLRAGLAAASIVVGALLLVDPLTIAAWETALLGALLIAAGAFELTVTAS